MGFCFYNTHKNVVFTICLKKKKQHLSNSCIVSIQFVWVFVYVQAPEQSLNGAGLFAAAGHMAAGFSPRSLTDILSGSPRENLQSCYVSLLLNELSALHALQMDPLTCFIFIPIGCDIDGLS